jgi:hypothetical protein
MIKLFNVLPFIEFIGIHKLDIVGNIKPDSISGTITWSLSFGPAEFNII